MGTITTAAIFSDTIGQQITAIDTRVTILTGYLLPLDVLNRLRYFLLSPHLLLLCIHLSLHLCENN